MATALAINLVKGKNSFLSVSKLYNVCLLVFKENIFPIFVSSFFLRSVENLPAENLVSKHSKSIVKAFRGPSFHLLIHTSKLGPKKDIDHLVAGTHGFKSIIEAFRGASFHFLINSYKLDLSKKR